MIFTTQKTSKKYFIDRILDQARRSNIALSQAEQYMLGWSETEKGFVIDQRLVDQFNQETTNSKFEQKIINLLMSAYATDIEKDSALKNSYREAYSVLNKGDHYILIMIKAAISSRLTNTLKDRVLLVLAAIAVGAIILGIQIALRYLGIGK
jgi:hypothetical protein